MHSASSFFISPHFYTLHATVTSTLMMAAADGVKRAFRAALT